MLLGVSNMWDILMGNNNDCVDLIVCKYAVVGVYSVINISRF